MIWLLIGAAAGGFLGAVYRKQSTETLYASIALGGVTGFVAAASVLVAEPILSGIVDAFRP